MSTIEDLLRRETPLPETGKGVSLGGEFEDTTGTENGTEDGSAVIVSTLKDLGINDNIKFAIYEVGVLANGYHQGWNYFMHACESGPDKWRKHVYYAIGLVGVDKDNPLYGIDPDHVGKSYAGKLLNKLSACYIASSTLISDDIEIDSTYWWFVILIAPKWKRCGELGTKAALPKKSVKRLIYAVSLSTKSHNKKVRQGKDPNDYEPCFCWSVYGWLRRQIWYKLFPSKELYIKVKDVELF